MKNSLTLIALLVSATVGFAQGKLQFLNDSVRVVYFSTNTTKLNPADVGVAANALTTANIGSLSGAPTLLITLWGGPTASSMGLQTSITEWSPSAGRWASTPVFFNGALGGPVLQANVTNFFQVQIYDSRATSAEDAWGHPGWYAGTSAVFTAVPQPSSYSPILLAYSPVFSTWGTGKQNLANTSGRGLIEVWTTLAPPEITSQPTDQVVAADQSATFTVTCPVYAPGGYQWRFNGTDRVGATGSSLTIPGAQFADQGSYCVVVTNFLGSATSAVATLTVLPVLITTQPRSQEAATGSLVSLTVAAIGAEPLRYRWRKNGVDLSDGGNITGVTSYWLELDNVQDADVGYYQVVVTNVYGAVTSAVATLLVGEAPVITAQPQDRAVCEGEDAFFSVQAASGLTLYYRWQVNGHDVVSEHGANS
jgi:hypothetical protein